MTPAKAPSHVPGGLDFERLFEAEFSYVWNTLRRLGVAARDLEDVTHEVFLRVHRQWAEYDPARAMRAWLFGFAYRLAADYRRLARHRIALVGDIEELDRTSDQSPLVEERLNARDAADLVQRTLDHIDFDQRAVFVMHDIDGCPMKDIAAALSIPINTAYSRLRLARARFTIVVRRIRQSEGRSS